MRSCSSRRSPSTGCAASTEEADPGAAAGPGPAGHFDPGAGYRLNTKVALRPEPFGALAYHFGSRRLTFLRSPLLVEVVRSLETQPSVDAALAAGVPSEERPAYRKALAALASSDFIIPR
jgi:mycofactocin biosynthesis protein MftB